MGNSILIRKARPIDVSEVVDINNAEFKWLGGEPETRDFFHEYLNTDFFWVAEDSNRIIGAMLVLPENAKNYGSSNFDWFKNRAKEYPKFLYVDRIVVKPDRQGKGIGSSLYKKLFEYYPTRPICCEIAIKPEVNGGSIRFHEHLGFEAVGERTYTVNDKEKTVRYFCKRPF